MEWLACPSSCEQKNNILGLNRKTEDKTVRRSLFAVTLAAGSALTDSGALHAAPPSGYAPNQGATAQRLQPHYTVIAMPR
jgi:hypothetical protein